MLINSHPLQILQRIVLSPSKLHHRCQKMECRHIQCSTNANKRHGVDERNRELYSMLAIIKNTALSILVAHNGMKHHSYPLLAHRVSWSFQRMYNSWAWAETVSLSTFGINHTMSDNASNVVKKLFHQYSQVGGCAAWDWYSCVMYYLKSKLNHDGSREMCGQSMTETRNTHELHFCLVRYIQSRSFANSKEEQMLEYYVVSWKLDNLSSCCAGS